MIDCFEVTGGIMADELLEYHPVFIRFGALATEQLDMLANWADLADRTEVVRNAIRFTDWLTSAIKAGWRIWMFRGEEQQEVEFDYKPKRENPFSQTNSPQGALDIELRFSTRALLVLNELENRLGAESVTDTIRYCLACYYWYLQQIREGWELGVEKDGTAKVIELNFSTPLPEAE